MKPENKIIFLIVTIYLMWLGFILGVIWILESPWPLLLLIFTPRRFNFD